MISGGYFCEGAPLFVRSACSRLSVWHSEGSQRARGDWRRTAGAPTCDACGKSLQRLSHRILPNIVAAEICNLRKSCCAFEQTLAAENATIYDAGAAIPDDPRCCAVRIPTTACFPGRLLERLLVVGQVAAANGGFVGPWLAAGEWLWMVFYACSVRHNVANVRKRNVVSNVAHCQRFIGHTIPH